MEIGITKTEIDIGDIVYPYFKKEKEKWIICPIRVFGGYEKWHKYLPHTTIGLSKNDCPINYPKKFKWTAWTNPYSYYGHGLKAFIKDFEKEGMRHLKKDEALEVIAIKKKCVIVKIINFRIKENTK